MHGRGFWGCTCTYAGLACFVLFYILDVVDTTTTERFPLVKYLLGASVVLMAGCLAYRMGRTISMLYEIRHVMMSNKNSAIPCRGVSSACTGDMEVSLVGYRQPNHWAAVRQSISMQTTRLLRRISWKSNWVPVSVWHVQERSRLSHCRHHVYHGDLQAVLPFVLIYVVAVLLGLYVQRLAATSADVSSMLPTWMLRTFVCVHVLLMGWCMYVTRRMVHHSSVATRMEIGAVLGLFVSFACLQLLLSVLLHSSAYWPCASSVLLVLWYVCFGVAFQLMPIVVCIRMQSECSDAKKPSKEVFLRMLNNREFCNSFADFLASEMSGENLAFYMCASHLTASFKKDYHLLLIRHHFLQGDTLHVSESTLRCLHDAERSSDSGAKRQREQVNVPSHYGTKCSPALRDTQANVKIDRMSSCTLSVAVDSSCLPSPDNVHVKPLALEHPDAILAACADAEVEQDIIETCKHQALCEGHHGCTCMCYRCIKGKVQSIHRVFLCHHSSGTLNISSEIQQQFQEALDGLWSTVPKHTALIKIVYMMIIIERTLDEVETLMYSDSFTRFFRSREYAQLTNQYGLDPSKGNYTPRSKQ